ncbi:HNH endonuclease [Kordiimonas aestuarii]|uniref:HNH endonuclease n=1 Tax=Kordiimonas aestuarii TaxID=1005925 RepID=UPI0021CF66EB|nr:HNH endonuclease [Kordiimonas aestuarii]
MAFGVFIHRADSIYDDRPAERYQFPQSYLARASACVGDWIVYHEPKKVKNTRGYFAVAKVECIVPDPTTPYMHLAIIEPGSYLDFVNPVPFNGEYGLLEQGLLNEHGKLSGWAQAAVRPLSSADFNRILDIGLADDQSFLPRTDDIHQISLHEEQTPFEFAVDRGRTTFLTSRTLRDRAFRQRVVRAYNERCAITGLKLINGGGRAEVEAAHIRPVEHGGPDIVNNGLALSGTVHWMFDRGLISLTDELEIIVSRQGNDPNRIRGLINDNGKAFFPLRPTDRPHPTFLAWHRENCFKH